MKWMRMGAMLQHLQNIEEEPGWVGWGCFLRRIMILGGAAAWTIPAYPSVHLWTWAQHQHQYQHQHGNNVSITFSISIIIGIGISISICITATVSLS